MRKLLMVMVLWGRFLREEMTFSLLAMPSLGGMASLFRAYRTHSKKNYQFSILNSQFSITNRFSP